MDNASSTPLEHRITSDELVTGIAVLAGRTAADVTDWSSPAVPYRYVSSLETRRETVRALSLVVVAQGSMEIVVDSARLVVGPFQYAVLGDRMHFRGRVDADRPGPFLALVMRIEPSVIRRIATIVGRDRLSEPSDGGGSTADPTPSDEVDAELLDPLIRFVRATRTAAERRSLMPIYLEEVAYRLMQRGQRARLIQLASRQTAENRLAAVMGFVRDNLASPITVSDLAHRANLSVSALTALFRSTTGMAPYEYVKETRLERARELLLEGRHDVATIARRVGYTSPSHFISQFRSRYGTTPKSFSAMLEDGDRTA